MEEKALLELLRRKPERGIRAVMEAYMGLCCAIVRARLADFSQEDIEECVSDVFLEIYRNRDRIEMEKGGIRAYLAVIARRRAIDKYHAAKKAETLPLEAETEGAEKRLAFEDRDALRDALHTLGEPDAKILVWKYYYGLATKEIAAMLGMKENTIDQRARRGLQKLRAKLEEGGFYE